MSDSDLNDFTCPLPLGDYERILLAHGGGGRLMQRLLESRVLPAFYNPWLARRGDSAVLELGGARLAFTTDSYVVRPLVFPGGDIGKLAVCGTLNDLAMAGAKPLYLSCGLIIEEGFPVETLGSILKSMGDTARAAGVAIVTGDTKVVDKGKGDGLFVNTAGVGLIDHPLSIEPASIAPGDAVVLSSDIGRHGIAIIAEREGLVFEEPVESDCADLSPLVRALLDSAIELHCLRDPTRGGLASALIETATSAGVALEIEEKSIPVCAGVRAACEILGYDPLYVANEGCFIAYVPADQAGKAVSILREFPGGANSAIIGRVVEGDPGAVSLVSPFGVPRLLDLLSGEQLPRIC